MSGFLLEKRNAVEKGVCCLTVGAVAERLPGFRSSPERGIWNVIEPRLKNIWVGGYHKDVIYIRFDILEPKPAKEPTAKRRKKRDT